MNQKINESDVFINSNNELVKDLFINDNCPILLSPYFITEITELPVINHIKSILTTKKTFIDIGAHIGFYSISLLNDFQNIYAFEPSKFQFDYLKRNVIINQSKNIKVSHVAAGSVHGFLQMNVMGRSGGTNTLVESIASVGDPIEKYSVEVVTIDSQKITDVDFIKIDVEGFELEVLKGAINTIKRYKPLILCEVWDKLEYRENIFNFMKEINYSVKYSFSEFPELALCSYNSNL
jgi:FkbM family methyltransferase